jgi:amino-acid N-acetyltransferase
MNERLRPAVTADLPAVLDLLQEAALPTSDLSPASLAGFLVAPCGEDGSLLGAGALEIHGRHGLLRSVVVTPDRRGAGIGGALTRSLLAEAAVRDLASVWLLTTTAADYFPAFGFRKRVRTEAPPAIAGSPEFANLCPANAVCLALEFSDARG